MDWDDLRLFLALARTRRLGTAATVVGKDTTTVARRIRRLEQLLGTTLFETGPAGRELTGAGPALLASAGIMEAEALAVAEAAAHGGRDPSGPIRVSVAEGFGSRILASRLASFTAAHPRVTLNLVASSGFLDPSRRQADLAVTLSRPRQGPLLVRKLTDYRLGLYARRGGLAGAPPATVADLLDRPLVGYVPDLIYAPELDYWRDVDPRLTPSIRSSSIIAQAELVASGAGLSLLPCFIGDRLDALERLLPDQVAITRTFWLVVHRDVRDLARVRLFIDWLGATVAALRPLLLGG